MIRIRILIPCFAVLLFGVTGLQTATATVRHHAPELRDVDVSPEKVVGGSATVVTGTVTLSEPADSTGDVVTLTSSDPGVASVPASVTVAAGARTATFSVATTQVFSDQHVKIRGEMGKRHRDAELKVRPFEVEHFSFNPSTVTITSVFSGLASTVGTVTLDEAAGAAGVQVQITYYHSTTPPTTITVAAGSKTVNFTLFPGSVTVKTVYWYVASVGHSHEHTRLTVLPMQ